MSSSSASDFSTGDIVGVVVGGVLGVIMLIGIILTCYALCCKKSNPPEVHPNPSHHNQPNPYAQPMNARHYPPQQPLPSYQRQQNPYA